MSNLNKSE